MAEITLEEEELAYFHMLGLCLAEWAAVEGLLFQVTSQFFPERERAELGMGYISIEGFRVKLKFSDNVVRRGLARITDKEKRLALKTKWAAVFKKLAHKPPFEMI